MEALALGATRRMRADLALHGLAYDEDRDSLLIIPPSTFQKMSGWGISIGGAALAPRVYPLETLEGGRELETLRRIGVCYMGVAGAFERTCSYGNLQVVDLVSAVEMRVTRCVTGICLMRERRRRHLWRMLTEVRLLVNDMLGTPIPPSMQDRIYAKAGEIRNVVHQFQYNM